jgi:hypothetical protein
MSNTRRASPDNPLRQERYCSSPEFERGLLANLVAKRCEVLADRGERELIWFLQYLSHCNGGLRKVANDLWQMRPSNKESHVAGDLDKLLVELCLNPEIKIEAASCPYFPNLFQILQEYRRRSIEAVRTTRVVTELGQQVFDALDYALEGRCLVLIEGLARKGKTFATKAWCDLHPGQARYIQVPSTNDDIGFYRAIARSLGVSNNLSFKAQQLRNRVEDVLQRGDLMVIFDEAHYLWPQCNYREALPARINWIMTALVNYGVSVALVTTPQFTRAQKVVEKRTHWASEQFIGRIAHYQKLPDGLNEHDLKAVARSLLPEGDRKSIETLVAYAQASAKYLAGIEAVVRRARFLATKENRTKVLFANIKETIQESAILSDGALAKTLSTPINPYANRLQEHCRLSARSL